MNESTSRLLTIRQFQVGFDAIAAGFNGTISDAVAARRCGWSLMDPRRDPPEPESALRWSCQHVHANREAAVDCASDTLLSFVEEAWREMPQIQAEAEARAVTYCADLLR